MRQFFKFFFASCLGILTALLVLFLIAAIVGGRAANQALHAEKIKPNSVLRLQFNTEIPERSNNRPLDANTFNIQTNIGLSDMVKAIDYASEDDNIQGIFLDLEGFPNGQVTASTLRKALVDFKESGKFIVAYSDSYSQNAYQLAAVADEIYVHHMGGIDFRGFATFIPFFKDMFDKLGVQWQVVYKGQYKGASEPYRLNEMSEANRKQIRQYLNALYDEFLAGIGSSRDIDPKRLREMADNMEIRNAEAALQAGLVTKTGYREEVMTDLRNRIGLGEDDKLLMPSVQQYWSSVDMNLPKSGRNQIALVYAEGTIVNGEGEEGMTGGRKYAKIIQEIRKNKKVKAIVLRVNSPGGSALASEDIWHELQLAQEEGIPVIASMGDVAASGGYYISCGADTILADPATITGSIGVVGMIPSFKGLLEDKLGVHFDTVLTGPFADGISPIFPIDKKTWNILDEEIDRMYTTFKKRVAEGRSLTMDQVEEIAQGRVWAGKDALEIGLVDKMGGLPEAIDIAASKAGVEEFLLIEYPKTKDPVNQVLELILGKDEGLVRSRLIESELGAYAPFYKYIKELKTMEGPQARLPFFIDYR